MSNLQFALRDLALDNFGRVVLTDGLIEKIENYDTDLSAGGTNTSCGGTANGGCSNNRCDGSVNASCTNQITCRSSANGFNCQSPVAELPSNSNCA